MIDCHHATMSAQGDFRRELIASLGEVAVHAHGDAALTVDRDHLLSDLVVEDGRERKSVYARLRTRAMFFSRFDRLAR